MTFNPKLPKPDVAEPLFEQIATADHIDAHLDVYILEYKLEFHPSGKIVQQDAVEIAASKEAVVERAARRAFTKKRIIREVRRRLRAQGLRARQSDIVDAVDDRIEKAHAFHKQRVIEKLLKPLSPHEATKAARMWRLASAVFAMPEHLSIAVLQHFMFQVFQKAGNNAVSNHLMPILVGDQNSGKTSFVKALLAPLEHLVAPAVTVDQIVHRNQIDMFRFSVLFFDDLADLKRQHADAFKHVITADVITKTRAQTHSTEAVTQAATMIGTTNWGLEKIFNDPSGYRRFVVMPFRNGDIHRSGDAKIWRRVGKIDFQLLWRSFYEVGMATPIVPHLEELAARQRREYRDAVATWLATVNPTSPDFDAIKTRYGIRAVDLLHRFNADTAANMSQAAFGRLMRRHAKDPDSPISGAVRHAEGIFYPVKGAPDVQAQ